MGPKSELGIWWMMAGDPSIETDGYSCLSKCCKNMKRLSSGYTSQPEAVDKTSWSGVEPLGGVH